MATMKQKKSNPQCKRSGHTFRFKHYIGERNYDLPNTHVDHLPKTAVFKCCNCGFEDIKAVKIVNPCRMIEGSELNSNGFYFFKSVK